MKTPSTLVLLLALTTLFTQPSHSQEDGSSQPNNSAPKCESGAAILDKYEYPVPGTSSMTTGDVVVHARVMANLWDGKTAEPGATPAGRGPVTIELIHGGSKGGATQVLYTAGGPVSRDAELGPMKEISPGAGIFQADFVLNSKMGIQVGDQLMMMYANDHSCGPSLRPVPNLVMSNPSTFAMQNAVLQLDKNVYVRGGDEMIFSLIDPTLNRDSQEAETVDLHAVRFQASGIDTTLADPAFEARPGYLTETGRDTGIFQVVLRMPWVFNVGGKQVPIRPDQQFQFVFKDLSPSNATAPGASFKYAVVKGVAADFHATVTLDQLTFNADGPNGTNIAGGDKVYITVVAPSYVKDPRSMGVIGDGREAGTDGTVTITAVQPDLQHYASKLDSYALAETGLNTGIFTGYIQLSPAWPTRGSGPTSGVLHVSPGQKLVVTFTEGGNSVSAQADIR